MRPGSRSGDLDIAGVDAQVNFPSGVTGFANTHRAAASLFGHPLPAIVG